MLPELPERLGDSSVRLPDGLRQSAEQLEVLLAVGHLLPPAVGVDRQDALEIDGRDVHAVQVEFTLGRDDADRGLSSAHLSVAQLQQPQQRAQVVAVARPQEVTVVRIALERARRSACRWPRR